MQETMMCAARMLRNAVLVVATLLSAVQARAADTVVFGTIGSASANLWPWFIGLDKGFFAAENVKLDVVYVPASAAAIKSLAELKGKVISIGGAKDITRTYAERMLAPSGLKSGDYDYVYAGATTARAQALLSGAV